MIGHYTIWADGRTPIHVVCQVLKTLFSLGFCLNRGLICEAILTVQ
ncbi:MAG: hypothetical protein GXY48_05685 [Methanomicrobiales archaeon]|nr:hypothetical protein [Methanomicrobiales archaeon]